MPKVPKQRSISKGKQSAPHSFAPRVTRRSATDQIEIEISTQSFSPEASSSYNDTAAGPSSAPRPYGIPSTILQAHGNPSFSRSLSNCSGKSTSRSDR